MRVPPSLETLLDDGIIQEVVRPLMSGKEAQIYVVVAAGAECVAKVYKEARQRSFKHRAAYTEGRRTANSRDQRAVNKRTRHGRRQDEAAWRSAEVDTLQRLHAAGVRVPEPINFIDGVLVMELVRDAQGRPAPRLGDLGFTPAEADAIHRGLLREVVRMLCAGVVHGDLSEFNVLMGADGPVLIDFPQAVDAAHNQNARRLLLRDVENLHRFVARFAPGRRTPPYAQEMWALYEKNRLEPDTELRGQYRAPRAKADTEEVLALIDAAERDEQARRDARGERKPVAAPRPLRAVVDFAKGSGPRRGAGRRKIAKPGARSGGGTRSKVAETDTPTGASRPTKPSADARGGGESAPDECAPRRTARRRRRRPRTTGTRGTR